MSDNRKRWREAQRELEATLAAHPYRREADELINLVFDCPMNSAKRALSVADWLREFVAAREFGCTGMTTDPDGPELETPDLPSIEDWARIPDMNRRERYRVWGEAGPPGSWQPGEPKHQELGPE